MATKKATKAKAPVETKAPTITVHCKGKKITIPNDDKASGKVNDFVIDKMRIGAFQLFSQGDESGLQVRLNEIGKYKGVDIYVRERNKAQ